MLAEDGDEENPSRHTTSVTVALIEHDCADPEFGGFLLWNAANCWPQQSDSVIDCDGIPKPVFKKLGPLFKAVRKTRQ